jgi:Carboxypeptidase regulatory-like domain/TonB-dependent Receptor Plug Domain
MTRWFTALMVALVVSVPSAALAQIASGNIYGTVLDQQGGVLPGANISLVASAIGGQPRTTITDAGGKFRFLNLDNGTYTVTIEMTGFQKQSREVIVNTGVNSDISFTLGVSTVSETVMVTAASPVVDVKKAGTAVTLTTAELEGTPQSKDPWAALKTVPGVIVDRVNVGGNESGQQSGFIGKGTTGLDTMWNLDGVVITDVNSGGASSSYYDFNAFEEVNISTGGNDLRQQTGGIGINFVTRRGTNKFKGNVYVAVNNHKMESSNLPDEVAKDSRLALPGGGFADKANHTDNILNRGFDIGGPIVKDKLWFWASWGRQNIDIIRLAQTSDKTVLTNTNAKINWTPTSNDQVSGFYFNGAKEKFGRSPGFPVTEPNSFLWNQGNFYPEEGVLHPLHGLWKVEDNHTFGSNLFVNAKYAWYGWGYGFDPIGGADKTGGVDYDGGFAYGSYITAKYTKAWHLLDVSGSAFKTVGGASHEFKFGFGYNRRPSDSLTRYSGNSVFAINNGGGDLVAQVYRDRVVSSIGQYTDLFFGDTISKGALTLNAGVRWDRQTARNLPSVAPANPDFPNILPSVSYDGSGPSIAWNDISPRISATFALDEARKTIIRGSYARYAGQLNPGQVTLASPVGSYYSYIAYRWNDLNGDHLAQKNEVLTNLAPLYWGSGIDIKNPGSAQPPPQQIASNYTANHDNEFIVGFDRELMPNFGFNLAYTYHSSYDIPGWNPRVGLTRADYTVSAPTTALGYSATVYSPNAAKLAASNGARILSNRPDYHTTYNGIEASLNKRLADRWFARVAISWNDYVENPDTGSIQNPTRTDTTGGGLAFAGPGVEGGPFAPRSGGSGKGDIFFNAKWQINANALYQFPMGFDVGANIFGRQGYARPFVMRLASVGDGAMRVVATPGLDDNRYPTLWDFDLRVAKNIKLGGPVMFNIAADVFNVMNSNTELARARQLNASNFGQLMEILSPRILRITAGIKF